MLWYLHASNATPDKAHTTMFCRRIILLYNLTHENFEITKVNLNDIKKLHVPDTYYWTFKLTDLDAFIYTLGAVIRNKAVLIDLIP